MPEEAKKGQAETQPDDYRPIRPVMDHVPAYGEETDLSALSEGEDQWLDEVKDGNIPEEKPPKQQEPDQSANETEESDEPEIETVGRIDPKWLKENHPELYSVWHNMQSDYTRKTQKLAAERKELESAKVEDPQVRQKADWWDQLNSMPGLVDQIRGYLQNQGQSPRHNNDSNEMNDTGYAELDELTPTQRKAVLDLIRKEVEPGFQDLYMREAHREINRLREELPGFSDHFNDIKKYRAENPSMSWEQAGRVVLFDKQREMGLRDAMTALTRKKMASTDEPTPSAFPARAKPQETMQPGRRLSAKEAVDFAAKRLGLIE